MLHADDDDDGGDDPLDDGGASDLDLNCDCDEVTEDEDSLI